MMLTALESCRSLPFQSNMVHLMLLKAYSFMMTGSSRDWSALKKAKLSNCMWTISFRIRGSDHLWSNLQRTTIRSPSFGRLRKIMKRYASMKNMVFILQEWGSPWKEPKSTKWWWSGKFLFAKPIKPLFAPHILFTYSILEPISFS